MRHLNFLVFRVPPSETWGPSCHQGSQGGLRALPGWLEQRLGDNELQEVALTALLTASRDCATPPPLVKTLLGEGSHSTARHLWEVLHIHTSQVPALQAGPPPLHPKIHSPSFLCGWVLGLHPRGSECLEPQDVCSSGHPLAHFQPSLGSTNRTAQRQAWGLPSH